MTTPTRTGGRTSQGRGPAPTQYVESGRIMGGASPDAGPVAEPATVIIEPAANGQSAAMAATPAAPKQASAPPPPKILRDSPIIPLLLIGGGAYLMWFGVKYWRGTGPATWPSYPLKSVLQGKGIPPNVQATTAETTLAAYETGAGSGGSTYSGPIPYRNPLRGVQGLQAQRIDMGVDYYGAGPIYAVGPGTITESDTSWKGGLGTGPGTFIAERLESGPLAGKYIYFSEHINPAVRVGQKVDVNTVIGTMTGGIETGFAAGPTGGTTLAAATGQASTSGDPGANTTAYGRAWSDVLAFLGAPAGHQGGPNKGTLPPGWWTGGGGQGNVHGKVTPRQVYVAFREAGLSRSASIWLTAITGVESRYNTTALNTDASTGDYSVGITQINYFGGLYAERAPHIGTPQQLLAGGLNDQARATAWLYNDAGGLGPWEPDITSGKVKPYLPGAFAAAKGGP